MNKQKHWKIYLIQLIILWNLITLNFVNGLGIVTNENDKFPGSGEIAPFVETTHIEAIEGRTALFTCPLIAPPSDKIYMVLWFRDDAGIPLYSIDARGKSLIQGTHWSDPKVFGTRAKFIVNSDPAYLEIKEIKRHDQGVYRCRVDFKKSQTNSFKFNLTVIIPPEDPLVLDGWGRPLNSTTIGPKEEGDDVTLTCRVIGGRPQPDVRWLINGLLVDDQFEQNFGNVIENRLLTPTIKRSDLHSIFTCQAVNTHLMEPKEKNYVLDMYLKPLTINITNTSLVLLAEQKYEVLCETTGSRPEALIMWFKGKKQLKKSKEYFINYKIKENFYENKTVSELLFVPTFVDDGVKLICRAENPKVNSFFVETSVSIEVHYPPVVNLQLGSTLSIDDIKEGADVYFECQIKANPSWRKLDWLHNGIPLVHNTSAKVIRSNQSLVLQKVNRQSAGVYQCSAFNKEGETRSNKLDLRVKFAPLCKDDKIIVIGASKGEHILLSCDIYTDPEAKKFRWKFENAEESLDITTERYGFNGTSSILNYTPIMDQDYGTISCWATNDVGEQIQPCLYQIILAGLPSPVKNCSWFNETQQSIIVQCQPGYDGGLPQMFILEIISNNDKMVRFNATNIDEPKFILNSLKFILLKSVKDQENDILKMFVYSMNQKGRSEGLLVKDFFIGNLKKNETIKSTGISPILIGTIITFTILLITIIIKYYIKFKKKKKLDRERYIKESKDSKCSLLNHNSNENHNNFSKTNNKTLINNSQQINNQNNWIASKTTTINCDSSCSNNTNNRRNSKLLIDFDFTTDDEKEEPDVISYPRFSASSGINPKTLKSVNEQQTIDEIIPMTSTTHLSTIVGEHLNLTTNSCYEIEKSDLDVNIIGISDLLMSTRVPESCV